MAGTYKLTIEQGANLSKTFTYYPTGTDNAAQDWTGWTGACQVRDSYPGSVLLTPSVAADASGNVTITATAASTAALAPGRAVWDLEMTRTSDGFVMRLMEGQALITPEVTRA